MDPFSRVFLKASLVWLSLGVTLGVAMLVWPWMAVYRAAHLHMNVLGFVAMMIFGVAYHVVPRFTGNPLHAPGLTRWHFWASNVGLALLAAGFIARAHAPETVKPVLIAGGLLAACGAYLFAYNVWRTLEPRRARRVRVHESPVSSLPVLQIRRG